MALAIHTETRTSQAGSPSVPAQWQTWRGWYWYYQRSAFRP